MLLVWLIIHNKKILLNRLHSAKIFSKFDMKSDFGKYRSKKKIGTKLHLLFLLNNTSGTLCHLNLKMHHLNFKKIMNDIFNSYSNFTIIYIDDVLIFFKSINHHFKHVNIFINIIQHYISLKFVLDIVLWDMIVRC